MNLHKKVNFTIIMLSISFLAISTLLAYSLESEFGKNLVSVFLILGFIAFLLSLMSSMTPSNDDVDFKNNHEI